MNLHSFVINGYMKELYLKENMKCVLPHFTPLTLLTT